MCGIAGYIGQSRNPKLSYELITSIFNCLEVRGIDASGVWGTEIGENGRVIYHKEPIRSSEFIKQSFWSKLKKIKTDMLLVHCRATSSHGGDPDCNENNHPFVSQDKRIGMIHNGSLEEAVFLKDKYQTVSETDSEILLRIFEHGMDKDYPIEAVSPEVSKRINGVKDIWSYISSGAMAVALGERVDDYTKNLFLFRNDKRPIWIADLRNLLGQIIFFSSPEVWYNAIEADNNLKKICWSRSKIIEIPNNEIWYLGIDYENNIVKEKNIHRFKIETKNTGLDFVKGDYKKIKTGQAELQVITEIDKIKENKKKNINQNNSIIHHDDSLWQKNEEESCQIDWCDFSNKKDHENLCKKINQTIDDIKTTIDNLCIEGSMSSHDYNQIIESLEQTMFDLEGTLTIIRS